MLPIEMLKERMIDDFRPTIGEEMMSDRSKYSMAIDGEKNFSPHASRRV